MEFLNKFLSILAIPAMVGIGLYFVDNQSPGSSRPLKTFVDAKSKDVSLHKTLDAVLSEDDGHLVAGQEAAKPSAQPKFRRLGNTNDAKTIVFDGSSGSTPLAEETIMALNVPENVRQEILKSYRKTGVMPSIGGRQPASGR